MRVTIRPTPRHISLAHALGTFLLAASIFVVLFAGLFPFDFDLPKGGIIEKIHREFDHSPEPPLLEDRVVNILFFMPFGFALAAVVGNSRAAIRAGKEARATVRIVSGVVASGILSGVVETGQVFLGFRDPTWSDIFMNTIGGGLGAGAYVFAGDAVLDAVAKRLLKLERFATARIVTIVMLSYLGLMLLLPALSGNRGELKSWESAYPLMIGNELTRDRPWRGSVSELLLASRAFSEEEIRKLHQADGWENLTKSFVGWYKLRGAGPFVDESGLLPKLEWMGGAPELGGAGTPVRLSAEHWLKTHSAATSAVQKIRLTSQFTVVVNCATDEIYQLGPARIVSISAGTHACNLMLGQERQNLALRLRTPVLGTAANSPQIEVDGVFGDTLEHQVAVTYRDALLIAYVDGTERGRIEITPEAAVVWRMYPRSWWIIRMEKAGFRSYAAVYRLLVFIPFGALLAAAVTLARFTVRAQTLVVAAAILASALALELIIGHLMVSGFQPRSLLISLFVGSATTSLILVSRGMKRRAAASLWG